MNRRLAGRYQIVRPIGGGGMGDVYQAVDVETGSTVAAKVMRPTGEDPLDALLRFQQEGAVLSTLKHPHIVQVFGAFLEDQTACIVMEFLEGRDLGQILQSGPMPLDRVRTIGTQVASALAYAHARGIIHRDVKPDNVMIAGDDQVKVTDFGIARVMRPGSILSTAPGVSIGTPLYMAPEQIEGETVDQRSDVYSLGVVLFHMIAGHTPFEGDNPLTIAFKHVHEAPPPLSSIRPGVPGEWEDVIARALAKNPAERFASVGELEEALTALDTAETAGGEETADRSPEAAPAMSIPEAGATRVRVRDEMPTSAMRRDAVENAAPADTRVPPETAPEPEPDARQTAIRARSPVREPEPAVREPEPTARQAETGTYPTTAGEQPASSAVATAPHPAEATTRERKPGPRWVPAAIGGVIVLAIIVAAAIIFLRPSGKPSPTASGPKIATWFPERFTAPTGLVVDSSGAVYVADSGSNKVVKVSRTGKQLASFGGTGKAALLKPSGVAVDAGGNVYVADTGHDRVVEYSPAGHLVRTWTGGAAKDGRLRDPADVALGARGNIYVADTNNNLVQHLSASGNWQTPYSGFKRPTGIAVNTRASIFVADTGRNRVEELAWSTDLLNESKVGQFQAPQGVAIDQDGNVYVADTGNNRIVKLSPGFSVLKVWGAKGGLNRPTAVAVDSNGRIYVADNGNNRVGRLH